VLRAFEETPDDPRVLFDLAALFGVGELPAELLARKDEVARALNARIGASEQHVKTKKIGGTKYFVHNPELASSLRAHWPASAIKKTIEMLTNHGTFTVSTDPKTGLIRTSDAAETWEMSERQWTTDSVMCGLLQRRTDPEGYRRAMLVNAASISSPGFISQLEKTIADPRYFRDGGKMNGVPHIFLPSTVRWDEASQSFDASQIELDAGWFNHKRLESQALLLGALAELWAAGNFAAVLGQREQVRAAIDGLARYLIAVNTDPSSGEYDFAAPSASSWEETPLPGGMTWDNAATVLAMEKLRGLGFVAEPTLEKFIAAGRRVVAERVERADPAQHPSRPADTSMLLLAASDYVFDLGDPVRDAQIRFQLVESMKAALLRDHGMLRYSTFSLEGAELHDSYLNRDFWMPGVLRAALAGVGGSAQEYGAKDAGDLEAMIDRQVLSKPEYSAQWCLGLSAALQALARAKISALENGAPEELVRSIGVSLDDMINRNLAVISGPGAIKSTGYKAPAWKVFEAYEAVTALDGSVRFVPGAHPLSWGAAQLYDGLRSAARAAELEERG
jgi:hypothetical protein